MATEKTFTFTIHSDTNRPYRIQYKGFSERLAENALKNTIALLGGNTDEILSSYRDSKPL
jgi:hypothetical protein